MGGRARHSVRAAIDIPADKLSQPPPSQCFTLKKYIMQVTVCKPVALAAKTSKRSGRVATGLPLPSTGRGIEGEGWSYPEPPRASLRWWTKSRCDSVCLRSNCRHLVNNHKTLCFTAFLRSSY